MTRKQTTGSPNTSCNFVLYKNDFGSLTVNKAEEEEERKNNNNNEIQMPKN